MSIPDFYNEYKIDKFRFGEIASAKLLLDAFKFRYDVYVTELGFEKELEHPSKMEIDAWDVRANHFACLDMNDTIIGYVRIIRECSTGLPIYTCTKINLDILPAEISRFCVSKQYRGVDKIISGGLIKVTVDFCQKHNLKKIFFLTERNNSLKNCFDINKVGDGINYHGRERFPCKIMLDNTTNKEDQQ